MTGESTAASPGSSPQNVAADVLRKLRSTGATLAVAESCTGGWLGKVITSIPGASVSFWGGVIAYDNDAKLKLLSVLPDALSAGGAVSERTAREMASGVVQASGATWGVGITGLAGPGGGTADKPVGTVHVAISGPSSLCRTYHLSGDRSSIRRQAVDRALELLDEALGTR